MTDTDDDRTYICAALMVAALSGAVVGFFAGALAMLWRLGLWS